MTKLQVREYSQKFLLPFPLVPSSSVLLVSSFLQLLACSKNRLTNFEVFENFRKKTWKFHFFTFSSCSFFSLSSSAFLLDEELIVDDVTDEEVVVPKPFPCLNLINKSCSKGLGSVLKFNCFDSDVLPEYDFGFTMNVRIF